MEEEAQSHEEQPDKQEGARKDNAYPEENPRLVSGSRAGNGATTNYVCVLLTTGRCGPLYLPRDIS
jgi:hypothetical protein